MKVALSGDGADELFMGYGWYQKYWHTPLYKRIFINHYSSYKKVIEVFSHKERQNLLKKGTIENDKYDQELLSQCTNVFDKINLYDLNIYLPGQLLVKVDRTSMMNSLEVRCPFLDTALVEFVYNLPIKYKLNKKNNKIILKDILSEIMPKEFVERRKQGFGAPLMDWLKEEKTKNEFDKIIKNENHPIYNYFNKKAVCDIFIKSDFHDKHSVQKVWSLLCICLWFELHQKNHE